MDGDVPCRFPNCIKIFENEQDLKDHMVEEPEHDYCAQCDVLCEDYDAYLAHLVQSDSHNACPGCGREFQSLRTLEFHINRDHRAAQKITCSGCHIIFRSAGDMIGHLEKGKCRNEARPQEAITKAQFNDHINQKTIIEKALRHDGQQTVYASSAMQSGPASMGTLSAYSNSTPRGGVTLNHMDSAPDEGPKSTPALGSSGKQWPTLAKTPSNVFAKPTNDTKVGHITSSMSSMSIGGNHPESLRTGSTTSGSQAEPSPQSTRSASVPSAWNNGSSAAVMAGNQQPQNQNRNDAFAAALLVREDEFAGHYNVVSTAAPQSMAGVSAAGPNDWNTRFWNPRSNAWNPDRFFNELMGAYECPHMDCSFLETSVEAFQAHCFDAHKPEVYRCPTCLREYKNLQALVQHCESSSKRCNIRSTKEYAKFMDYVTGGFVNASKRNQKGQVLYEMTRPQEFADRTDRIDRTKQPNFW